MNTVFNKVLGENEKCVFYFYLKNKELSGQPIDAPLRLLPGGRSCANHDPEAPPPGGGSRRARGRSRALGTCPMVALAPRRLLGKNASFSFCKVPFITKQSYAAAAAKSLKSRVQLCSPIDGSPPGSPVPGTLRARTQEWVAISFSSAWKWKVKVKPLSRLWLFTTPGTAAYQAPPSMGFSRWGYWSGVPLPSP